MNNLHSWKIRRRFMFVVMGFCMAVILMALLFRPDAGSSATVIMAAFGTITATLGSYVFGATWDDKNRAKSEAEVARYASVLPLMEGD